MVAGRSIGSPDHHEVTTKGSPAELGSVTIPERSDIAVVLGVEPSFGGK